MLFDKRGAEMAEAAVTLPVVVLVMFFVINGTLAGYTAMAAANAANEGARAGAVARSLPEQRASNAAVEAMKNSGAGGGYSVSVKADREPGGAVKVMVAWNYPSMLSGFCSYFGVDCPSHFGGATTATRKREGW